MNSLTTSQPQNVDLNLNEIYQLSKFHLKKYVNKKANEMLNKIWLSMVENFMDEKFETPNSNKQLLPIDYTGYEF